MKWLLQAAEKGDPKTQFLVGSDYSAGNGVGKDPAAAARWFRKAAEQGYPPAQNAFGLACASSDGVALDLVEAHKWLSLATTHGDASAGANLKKLLPRLSAEQIAEGKKRADAFLSRP